MNLRDFNILAANFGQSPRDFTQGDFNYDMIVNLDDFNILASRFGVALGPDFLSPDDWMMLALPDRNDFRTLLAELESQIEKSKATSLPATTSTAP